MFWRRNEQFHYISLLFPALTAEEGRFGSPLITVLLRKFWTEVINSSEPLSLEDSIIGVIKNEGAEKLMDA